MRNRIEFITGLLTVLTIIALIILGGIDHFRF